MFHNVRLQGSTGRLNVAQLISYLHIQSWLDVSALDTVH